MTYWRRIGSTALDNIGARPDSCSAAAPWHLFGAGLLAATTGDYYGTLLHMRLALALDRIGSGNDLKTLFDPHDTLPPPSPSSCTPTPRDVPVVAVPTSTSTPLLRPPPTRTGLPPLSRHGENLQLRRQSLKHHHQVIGTGRRRRRLLRPRPSPRANPTVLGHYEALPSLAMPTTLSW